MRAAITALILAASCAASPKTSAHPLALTGASWTMHTLASPTSQFIGADGVHIATVGGKPSACTPWENKGGATIAALDGSGVTWIGSTTTANGEDAYCADYDADGNMDIAIASEGLKKIKFHWGPAFTATTVLDHTHGAGIPDQQWAQLDYADLGSGPVLIAGGKTGAGAAAQIGYLTVSGSARTAANWTFHSVSTVGWTMTLKAIDLDGDSDLDLFWTDRNGTARGVWWAENVVGPSPTWSPHQIAAITGSDVPFGDAADLDADGHIDVVAGNRTTLTVYLWINGSWSPGANLYPAGAGDLHGVAICDLDNDQTPDILTTYALTAIGDSWVGWIDQTGGDHEISGAAAVQRKPDQPACFDVDGDGDLDVITAEGGDAVKTDDLGVVWFANPQIP